MKRLVALLVPLAACGSGSAPARKAEAPREAAAPAPPVVRPATTEAELAGGGDAAAALGHYYKLIESGDYEGAAGLRSGGTVDAARLADNFKAYRSYHAQIGAPSRPVAAGGWLYVEVPVMITGSFRGGKAFGSTGSVTLRRAAARGATPADRQWRVYTGG